MSKYSALIKRASNATAALALTLASLTPAVMLGSTAKAAQITGRSITMASSTKGQANVTYTLAFTAATSGDNLDAVVVDFCSNSPIIGASCTAPAGLDLTGTSNWTHETVEYTATVVDTNGATAGGNNRVEFVNGTGADIDAAEPVSIAMNVDNPSALGSFYARVYTYADSADKGASATSIGTERDSGGIALSTTDDVTINARVQEQLTFCVGAVAAHSGVTTCGDITESVIDLGVLSSGNTATTPVASGTDGNDREGTFLVTTNAVSGVIVSYTTATSLKVGGAACENVNTNLTDQCINADEAAVAFAGTEKFGMSITNIRDAVADVTGETNLTAMNDYGTGYAWDTDSSVQIAQSTSVVVADVAELTFKATPAATTPSGLYSTSANFVATATF